MDTAKVDWSMGSGSPRLADWNLAGEVGRRLAGTGVAVAPADRARLREDISELVALSQSLVAETTGLPAPRLRARAWVMSRGEWISANLRSLQRLLEPLAERIVPGNRGELRRKALGAQMGALLGYVSRKVLGQYDLFLPPDDEGLMYFVGPNIAGAEQKFALPARDFRLWISLHEITHRAQFASAPWLRAHLTGLVDTYFSSIQMDPKELMNQLRRAVQEARDGAEWKGAGAIFLLLSPEQREVFSKVQSMMSLLEGHASYTMNEAAKGRVEDLGRMRRALQVRRRASGIERSFQRAIGFDSKVRQYESGERFVREAIARSGLDGFNRVWQSEENLPTLAEVGDPSTWVERVAGS